MWIKYCSQFGYLDKFKTTQMYNIRDQCWSKTPCAEWKTKLSSSETSTQVSWHAFFSNSQSAITKRQPGMMYMIKRLVCSIRTRDSTPTKHSYLFVKKALALRVCQIPDLWRHTGHMAPSTRRARKAQTPREWPNWHLPFQEPDQPSQISSGTELRHLLPPAHCPSDRPAQKRPTYTHLIEASRSITQKRIIYFGKNGDDNQLPLE